MYAVLHLQTIMSGMGELHLEVYAEVGPHTVSIHDTLYTVAIATAHGVQLPVCDWKAQSSVQRNYHFNRQVSDLTAHLCGV